MNENIARNQINSLGDVEHATITQKSRQVAKALNTREDTSLATEPTAATATDGDSAYASLARSGTSVMTETPPESSNQTQQRERRVRGTDKLVFKEEVGKKRLEHYDNVIPAPDTFNNVKECMGAISVELPGLKEIEAIHETEPILPAQKLTDSGRKVKTIFTNNGTPSSPELDTLRRTNLTSFLCRNRTLMVIILSGFSRFTTLILFLFVPRNQRILVAR
jgi:hypothetical protein